MIKIEIPLDTPVEVVEEMKEWLLDNCDNDQFYFFPLKLAIERPAIVKFENKEDAFAFRFMYNLLDLKTTEV